MEKSVILTTTIKRKVKPRLLERRTIEQGSSKIHCCSRTGWSMVAVLTGGPAYRGPLPPSPSNHHFSAPPPLAGVPLNQSSSPRHSPPYPFLPHQFHLLPGPPVDSVEAYKNKTGTLGMALTVALDCFGFSPHSQSLRQAI